MNLRIVDHPEEFERLKPDWERLTNEPLLSWAWHYYWFKFLGRGADLHILVGEVDGQTIGIAPFMIVRQFGSDRIRFLGSGSTCTDYIDIIADSKFEKSFNIAVSDHILGLRQKKLSLVELEGIPLTDNKLDLVENLAESFWRYDRDLESSWVISLPDSWEDFVRSASKSLRRKIKKAEKRFASGEVEFRSTLDGLDFDKAMRILVDLHQQRFESKGEPGVFADKGFTKFLWHATRELAANHRAEICVTFQGDEPVAAHLYLHTNSGPQMYQSGINVDKTSLEPGHLMFAATVRKTIENGYREFDFLRGDEPYKAFWGAHPVPLCTVRCVSKGFLSTMTHQLLRSLREIKKTVSKNS